MSRSADAMSGGSFVFPFATVSNESYTIQGEQGSSHFHDFRRSDAAIPACETPVARGLTLTLLVHMHKGCTRGAQGVHKGPIPCQYQTITVPVRGIQDTRRQVGIAGFFGRRFRLALWRMGTRSEGGRQKEELNRSGRDGAGEPFCLFLPHPTSICGPKAATRHGPYGQSRDNMLRRCVHFGVLCESCPAQRLI